MKHMITKTILVFLFACLTALPAVSAEKKYKTISSDTKVPPREAYNTFVGKRIDVGSRWRGVTLGKKGVLYDSYGKRYPHRIWLITKDSRLCFKDKNSNWGACYVVVKNKSDKIFLAGTKRRFRDWIKEGKITE